ncbi:MAG TPA: phytoene/squalene synthase family protein [Pirellulales bacterium]|nr:phytoene/squalene synthase family protein [Pirellulales bacterium]
MNATLHSSYAYCGQLTRRTAGNFYYSFLVLPREKRQAMSALYAFSRVTDDLGDNDQPVEMRRAALVAWRRALQRALDGAAEGRVLPALVDTLRRYGFSPAYLHDLIDGVETDLQQTDYQTFDELRGYCHKVASAVGLCCIHIWGFTNDAAFEPARKCGLAFQLTNILRDLEEDAAEGRVYLPQEDLERFGYSVQDLRQGLRNDRFQALMRFEIARAERFYQEAADLQRWLEPDGKTVFGAMTGIYRGLLNEIKRLDGDVFGRRVRLSAWRKLRIAGRWLFVRPASPIGQPHFVEAASLPLQKTRQDAASTKAAAR